jgi:hypothetical protein
MRHIWTLHYCEIGFAKLFQNLVGRYSTFWTLFVVLWMPLGYTITHSILISLMPVFLISLLFFLLIIDSVYTSRKIYDVLKLCQKYVCCNLTADDLLKIVDDNLL